MTRKVEICDRLLMRLSAMPSLKYSASASALSLDFVASNRLLDACATDEEALYPVRNNEKTP